MKLWSSAFSEGEPIPLKYTCDGENVSPPLEWDNVPEQTAAFALVVDDPDAPSGVFVHWVLFNIPAGERGVTEGIGIEASEVAGGVQGKNGFSKTAYGGPCPPSGTHRYYFRLYALESSVSLPRGNSRKEIDSALQRHVIAEAELMGRYSRKQR